MASGREKKPSKRTVRVAIIGGGCAGLAAAWELSKQPGYEISVYEKSWRLGGKGASGRDGSGHICEHGLHIWLGFYENAFRMMRECYAEVEKQNWGPKATEGNRLAHGSMEEAFFPEPHIGVAIPEVADGDRLDFGRRWDVWSSHLPPAKGLPGERLDEGSNPFTLTNYILRCFELIKALIQSTIGPPDGPVPGNPRPEERSKIDEAIELDFSFDPARSPTELVEWVARLLRGGLLTTAAGLLQAVTTVETMLQKLKLSSSTGDSILHLMEAIAAQSRKLLRDVVAVDPKLRYKTEIIDIVMTIAVGLYRDRVLFDEKGLDAINDIDYRDWLLQNGATKTSVASQFLTGIYDLTFAYRDGDRRKPALAAGVALRGALRMFFTYRGAMFWRMRTGMGDAVFAPLYKVLKTRNVKFHFLHSLSDMGFVFGANGERHVTRLNFDAPATPLADDQVLDHFGCWPAASPISPGRTKTPIEAPADFDAVILATGVDDFHEILKDSGDGTEKFFKHLPAWEMRGKVQTVATQAAQVWLNRDLERLGWYRGAGIFTAFEAPFETWADMTQTLASEKAWRAARKDPAGPTDVARTVAYFCAVLPESDVRKSKDKTAIVADNLKKLLTEKIKPIWPSTAQGSGGAEPFVIKSYVQANFEGSDRYTLSLPGSLSHRISPLDPSVANMAVAGDWTASGLDAGCVEGAVMSGMLAALAITNDQPEFETIVGYDHP